MSRRADSVLACVVGATYFALLVVTAPAVGYTRDEGFYIRAARAYGAWLLAPRRYAVDDVWTVNHEHPGLAKSLFALAHLGLERLGLGAGGLGYRAAAMALAAIVVGVLFRYAARRWGRAAGVVAALSLAFMPRFFFHAHLACLDVPVAALTTLTAFAYLATLRSHGAKWPLVTGALFGLALATKHTAALLLLAVALHLVAQALLARLGRRPPAEALRRGALALVAMGTLGPALLVAVWPWLWHDTVARLIGWAGFHAHHPYYDVEYLGQIYWRPPMPRSYALVMTVATVPTVTLLLAGAGLLSSARRGHRRWRQPPPSPATNEDLFLALAAFAFYAPWLSSRTPIFGGTKHWLGAYPFLALFAAAGFARAVAAVRACPPLRRSRAARRLVPALAALSVLVAPAFEALHARAFGLGAYVPLVGGAAGAASLGLQRGFWGYATPTVVPLLDRTGAPRGKIYVHDAHPLALQLLHDEGRLGTDSAPVLDLADADAALFFPEPQMAVQEYRIWEAFGTTAPAFVDGLDGVPMVLVYQRGRSSTRVTPAVDGSGGSGGTKRPE